MIVGTPADTPVTIPELEPTVACAELLLVQVPPEGDALNVVLNPIHRFVVPVIAEGTGLTVIAFTAEVPPHGKGIE